MEKKGSDTPFNTVSAELARVEAHVSDNDAALSRLALSVEALSSKQDVAAAAIAGIQASTASAQTAHDEVAALLSKTTAATDELKAIQASADAALTAQAIETTALTTNVNAVTDDIKNFQASTETSLTALSVGATSTSMTVIEVQDELKKCAGAHDDLLAQFMALKDRMAIDRAFDTARISQLEGEARASEERAALECSSIRAQTQDMFDTMTARLDEEPRAPGENKPFLPEPRTYEEGDTAAQIEAKMTSAEKAKLDVAYEGKVKINADGVPDVEQVGRLLEAIRKFWESSTRVFGGTSQVLPHFTTITSKLYYETITRIQTLTGKDAPDGSEEPRTSASLVRMLREYIDIVGNSVVVALRTKAPYSYQGPESTKHAAPATNLILSSIRIFFKDAKEKLDACAKSDRQSPDTAATVVMRLLRALPRSLDVAIRAKLRIEGDYTVPENITFDSFVETTIQTAKLGITAGTSMFSKPMRDALLGLTVDTGSFGGGSAAAANQQRRAAGMPSSSSAPATAPRKPPQAVAAGGAGHVAATVAATAAAGALQQQQRGSAADAAAFASRNGRNVNFGTGAAGAGVVGSFSGKCYTCQQQGHRTADCPTKK